MYRLLNDEAIINHPVPALNSDKNRKSAMQRAKLLKKRSTEETDNLDKNGQDLRSRIRRGKF